MLVLCQLCVIFVFDKALSAASPTLHARFNSQTLPSFKSNIEGDGNEVKRPSPRSLSYLISARLHLEPEKAISTWAPPLLVYDPVIGYRVSIHAPTRGATLLGEWLLRN
jgi:hypothetical protein